MKPKRRCIKLDYCTYFFVAGFLGEKLSFHLASTHSFPLCWFSSLSYNSQYLLFSLEEIKMGPLKKYYTHCNMKYEIYSQARVAYIKGIQNTCGCK